MKKCATHLTLALFFVSVILSLESFAQQKQIAKGTVQRIKIHSNLLEGNLSGDSADRYVSVYLPASYNNSSKRRYPVVYFLHGYTDDDAKFYGFRKHWMVLPPILDTVFAQDPSHEMIVVTPDAYTLFQGSMYSNSATTGNWEDFVSGELVNYIDSHYRTMPKKRAEAYAATPWGAMEHYGSGKRIPMYFRRYIC